LCQGCHRDRRVEGKAAGPIRCRDCHPRK
jgi:hypothetical protein